MSDGLQNGRLKLLDGVKIVSLSAFLIGPAAAQYLADMGADVVKVEEPSRGPHERHWSGADTYLNGVSAFFLMSNRNVRSVAVDLKTEEGRAIAIDLCRGADAVITNFRPPVTERLGLDYESLRAENPSLVYACATGYGSDSPYRDLPGQDLLLQAMMGMAASTGTDGPPVAAGSAVVDQHAAALLAMGVLAALFHRALTGEGQRVEVTMAQSAIDLQAEAYTYQMNGSDLRRPDHGLATTFHEAPYGFYEVTDGYVALSISPLALISEALGDPEQLEPYLDPALRFSERAAIYDALSPLVADYSKEELVSLLREHGVWCAPVNSFEDAIADPAVMHLSPFAEFAHEEAGQVRVPGLPLRFSSGAAEVTRVPPDLGEHTDEVLESLGYDEDRVAALRGEGVIR
ncbi:MAG: CoA transferase [Actinobacteria bacterium]|nr:CoA transferase [Actinomycetota bacterium]